MLDTVPGVGGELFGLTNHCTLGHIFPLTELPQISQRQSSLPKSKLVRHRYLNIKKGVCLWIGLWIGSNRNFTQKQIWEIAGDMLPCQHWKNINDKNL